MAGNNESIWYDLGLAHGQLERALNQIVARLSYPLTSAEEEVKTIATQALREAGARGALARIEAIGGN